MADIVAMIEKAVAAATAEVAEKIETVFKDKASANVRGETGEYLASIKALAESAMQYKIFADPADIHSDPENFHHGSSLWGGKVVTDVHAVMTELLGDGKCGPLFGDCHPHPFWNDIVSEVDANFDTWARAALEHQGLHVL